MTVTVTGSTLSLTDVVAVARRHEPVQLDPRAFDRMQACRAVVEQSLEDNQPVYGLTTGVAELKRVRLAPSDVGGFNSELILSHRIGQGPPFDQDLVRAAMLRLLNGLASGYPGVRPELATILVEALNRDARPPVRSLGSIGQADLGPNADLAAFLFDQVTLAPGEALALLDHNAFSTGAAALALSDSLQLAGLLTLAGALSLEGFAANLSIIDPVVPSSRPFRGLQRAVADLTRLLEGSALGQPGVARNLQDPLSFRNLPQLLAALADALDYARTQLAGELNASQSNPIVALEARRMVSVGNFEALPLAAALDFTRIAIAPVLTSAAERTAKLVGTPWSGLRTGLLANGGAALGLAELAVVQAALAGEARLLANPVSFDVVTTSLAEGIEDRVTMAPLGARRLSEMVSLGRRIVAIEMVVAAQAVELRRLSPLGAGTSRALRLIRDHVPFLQSEADFPIDFDPVVAAISQLDLQDWAESPDRPSPLVSSR